MRSYVRKPLEHVPSTCKHRERQGRRRLKFTLPHRSCVHYLLDYGRSEVISDVLEVAGELDMTKYVVHRGRFATSHESTC